MADSSIFCRFSPSIRFGGFFAAALIAAGMFTVSACVPPTLRELAKSAEGAVEVAAATMRPSSDAESDPLLVFLAEAEDGEVREIQDPSTGGRLRVKAGRVYHAASGRLCRRYAAGTPAALENGDSGLTCKDAKGEWVRVALLTSVSP